MTNKLPTTSYIFVDRRKTGRGKSLPNRQRLLRRIQDAIRESKPTDIDSGGVKSMGGATSGSANPVKVTRKSLHEPSFHYASGSGKREIVLIGNDDWERGDEFPLAGDDDAAATGGGPGEDSEDDFIVNVSRDEFFNVFFEDCALPDLQETHAKDLPQAVSKPAGFKKDGNPGSLSLIRSFKNAMPRKGAMTRTMREELKVLEARRDELMSPDFVSSSHDEWEEDLKTTLARIQHLKSKISNVPVFEKVDLRYRKREKVLVKAADAVFVMIMDISGSMDENKKRIARKFFSLQYAFIKRKYPQTDLVFIAHTDQAEEMTEEDFFSTRKSGGTIVSPAYTLAHQIIQTRYDAQKSNIYLSQASDGDNWDFDNSEIIPELEQSGLLSKLRHMSYAQVGESFTSGYGGTGTLWKVLESISNAFTVRKLSMVKIDNDEEVFDAFQKIYKKHTATKA